MNLHIDNRTEMPKALVEDTLWQAVHLVFSSAPGYRRIATLHATVKPLQKRCSPDANPSGCAFVSDRRIICRIDSDWRNYPVMYAQTYHPEWPAIKVWTPTEALLTVACHEFAHLVLPRKLGHKFEEWLAENIAVTSLLISRGVVKSKLNPTNRSWKFVKDKPSI